jgi:hypothetical protein
MDKNKCPKSKTKSRIYFFFVTRKNPVKNNDKYKMIYGVNTNNLIYSIFCKNLAINLAPTVSVKKILEFYFLNFKRHFPTFLSSSSSSSSEKSLSSSSEEDLLLIVFILLTFSLLGFFVMIS